VAPTLAVLLGTNLPATGQGRPLSEFLALNAEQTATLEAAWDAQQVRMVNAYADTIGERVRAATQSFLTTAQNDRLSQERLWRTPLVLIAWLIPLALLIRQRRRAIAWGVGGALLYLVLFNLRYAVIDRQSYSFSAISSPPALALYSSVTSLVALTLVWALALVGGGGFRQGGRRAAEITLVLTIITLYGLSLPVGWSLALNGPVATWTLPDSASLYVALLSGIQMVLVGIWGVVLAGLAALVGARLKPGAA
jgi:hypothetical protein